MIAVKTESKDSKTKHIFLFVLLLNIILIGTVLPFKLFFKVPTILNNQVGYLPNSPKSFMVKSDFVLTGGYFEILNENKEIIITATPLEYLGELWDAYYYFGNFSSFSTIGNYTIRVKAGLFTLTSFDFEISNTVYDLSLQRGYEFFYYQRSNCKTNEIVTNYPGHELDHMDDGVVENGTWRELYGGWFSAGDFNKHIFWGSHIEGGIYAMLSAYERRSDLFNKIDVYQTNGLLGSNQIPDILDEAMWGLNYTKKLLLSDGQVLGSLVGDMIFVAPEYETDQIIGNKDDRYIDPTHNRSSSDECMWIAAGFARCANIIIQTQNFSTELQTMKNYAQWIYSNYTKAYNISIPYWSAGHAAAFLAASMQIARYDPDPIYQINAMWAANASANHLKDITTNEDDLGHVDRATGLIIEWAIQNKTTAADSIAREVIDFRWKNVWEPNLTDKNNFFHLIKMFDNKAKQTFYFKEGALGCNSLYLYTIYALALSQYYTNGTYTGMSQLKSYLIEWMFGKNPFQICMMESLGDKNLPAYHHRYIYCKNNPRGAVPGAVPNGVTLNKGKIFVDMMDDGVGSATVQGVNPGSNEPWLPHNCAFLHAFSILTTYLA